MSDQKNNSGRRFIQNLRLVNRDFPWLWAVCRRWDFVDDEIKIIRGKYNRKNVLWPSLIARASVLRKKGLDSVFILIGIGVYVQEVREVCFRDGLSLADCIKSEIPDGYAVSNIVEANKCQALQPGDPELILRVHCLPDHVYFNYMVEEAKRFANGEPL
ncbi:MAG: hypothetical protein WC528_03630 [Patescibacteria group bacterium]